MGVENQAHERIVEVPHTLIQETAVEVPQIQEMVAVREEHKHVIKEVSKTVPKFEMKYVEKLVEVEHNVHHEKSPHGVEGSVNFGSVYSAPPTGSVYAAPPGSMAMTE